MTWNRLLTGVPGEERLVLEVVDEGGDRTEGDHAEVVLALGPEDVKVLHRVLAPEHGDRRKVHVNSKDAFRHQCLRNLKSV